MNCSNRKYHSAYKRNILVVFLFSLVFSHQGRGEDIFYDGSASLLQTTPSYAGGDGITSSLFVSDSASENTVVVDFSTGVTPYHVFGGLSNTKSVKHNSVFLYQGTIHNNVFGGFASGAGMDVIGNSVTVDGIASAQFIVGGFSDKGSAFSNTVTMSSGTVGAIWAADVGGDGSAFYNSIVMTGGTVNNSLTGAYVDETGVGAYNTVEVSGGSVDGGIWGASTYSGDARDNIVTISGSASVQFIRCGWTDSGDSINNVVLIRDGMVLQSITAGYSNSGAAVGNMVTVEGGKVVDIIYGGESASGSAIGNSVIITGGEVTGVRGGSVYDAGSEVRGNRVVVHNGLFKEDKIIYGGINAYASSTGDVVVDNQVVIYDGDLTQSTGITGGFAVSGNAVNNSVYIHGGIGIGNIDGGRSDADGLASDNLVVITGGEFRADVIIAGGRTTTTGGNGSSHATNNTVRLTGAPVLSNSRIFGGYTGLGWDGFTGNRLEVWNYKGSAVGTINNFQYYDYLLQTSQANGEAILTLEGSVHYSPGSDISNSITTINFNAGGGALFVNDRITLIHDQQDSLSANDINKSVRSRQGIAMLYDLDLFANSSELYAVVRQARAAPEAKSLSEGRSASLAFIRQGQDLVVDSGIAAASSILSSTGDGWSGATAFGTVGGGHFRHKTGSHADVNGLSMLSGLAWRNNGPCGSLLLGAFFETGYADYDTHNTFTSGAVRGDGDSRYIGGGVLARYEWEGGWYVEGSGRIGAVKNHFNSDLTDIFGNRARYSVNSVYFGMHAGAGYLWQTSGRSSIDISAKYLWSRQNGDSAVIAGDPVRFDADDSHRLRTGARFSVAVNDSISPYVGAAFENEFRGKSRAGAYGYGFGVPSLKGGTGIGELGLALYRKSVSADLGIQGHCGRRSGVTGSVRVGVTF